jgi:hypothetical protein
MAEVITSGKVIQKPDIVLESDDFLPPGILNVRTKTRDESGILSGEGSESTADPTEAEENGGDGPEKGTLDPDNPDGLLYEDRPGSMPVPKDMRIISQTVKVGDDKKITVDVVIETSDFPGIKEFDVRWTKSQL